MPKRVPCDRVTNRKRKDNGDIDPYGILDELDEDVSANTGNKDDNNCADDDDNSDCDDNCSISSEMDNLRKSKKKKTSTDVAVSSNANVPDITMQGQQQKSVSGTLNCVVLSL